MPELKPLCPNCLEIDCSCTATEKKLQPLNIPNVAPKTKAKSSTVPNGVLGSGRGPTGRLRNFKAMADDKLAKTLLDLLVEQNTSMFDPDAIDAVNEEMSRRPTMKGVHVYS
jgi:hypothetical protein